MIPNADSLPPESVDWTGAEWNWWKKLCEVHEAVEAYNQSWSAVAKDSIPPLEAFIILTLDRRGDAGSIPSCNATDEQITRMLTVNAPDYLNWMATHPGREDCRD